jgi:hypothetical protein
MHETIFRIRQAEYAHKALLARYTTDRAQTIHALSEEGYTATAARIMKPCKELLENWESFILEHNGKNLSLDQLAWVHGITCTMEKYLLIVFDESFLQESKQEEDELRRAILDITTRIRFNLTSAKNDLVTQADIEHFIELEECRRIETFSDLENLNMRLQIFYITHFPQHDAP